MQTSSILPRATYSVDAYCFPLVYNLLDYNFYFLFLNNSALHRVDAQYTMFPFIHYSVDVVVQVG